MNKKPLSDRVSIAMAYDGTRTEWAPDMPQHGKDWWRAKAKLALLEVRSAIQERKVSEKRCN